MNLVEYIYTYVMDIIEELKIDATFWLHKYGGLDEA